MLKLLENHNYVLFLNCSRFQVFMLHSNMQTSDQKKVLKTPPAGIRKIVSVLLKEMRSVLIFFFFIMFQAFLHVFSRLTVAALVIKVCCLQKIAQSLFYRFLRGSPALKKNKKNETIQILQLIALKKDTYLFRDPVLSSPGPVCPPVFKAPAFLLR